MKLGIVIPCYNRADYLRQCLDSLKAARIPEGTEIVFVDDKSTDKETVNILNHASVLLNATIITRDRNSGVCVCLDKGIEHLFYPSLIRGDNPVCDIVMNLDSDAIVRPDFIEKIISLKEKFPDKIVTGFNCLTKNANGTERHPIIEAGEGYNIKSSVGGINMCFDRDQYQKWILPALEKGMKRLVNWDAEACKNSGGAVCTVPSVVQHIGINSSMGHSAGNEPMDVADDFVMDEADHVFVRGKKIYYSDKNHFEWWGRVSRNEWEPETFDVFDKEIVPGKVFIDIGAWNGAVSLYASKLGAKCYTVEPDKGIHKILDENVKINRADISVHKLAIGNVNGEIDLNAKGEFGDSESSMVVRFNKYAAIEKVKSLTLESFIAENNIDIGEVCLIKIDIEAGEVLLIPQMSDYLEKHKPNIYIAFHPGWFPDLEENTKMIADTLFPIYNFIGMNGQSYSKDEFIAAMHTAHDHAFLLKGKLIEIDEVKDALAQSGTIFDEFEDENSNYTEFGIIKPLEQPSESEDKRLHLPNVTLVTVNCDKIKDGVIAMNECTMRIKFGAHKFITSASTETLGDAWSVFRVPIAPLDKIEDYSHFIVKELYKYIDTEFVLIVQSDGYVKNPAAWDSAFLQFDYIGATWWHRDGMNVGNGGFSLRSKRLMEIVATDPQIRLTHPEDHHICRTYRRYLERKYGIRYASEEAARKFSIEGHGRQEKKYYTNEFGFHGFTCLNGTEKKPVTMLDKQTVSKVVKPVEVATIDKNSQDKKRQEVLIINQPFGLGDHLFIIALLRQFISNGHKIIVPVVPQYSAIGKHFPEITFIDKSILTIDYERKDEYDLNGATVIPLRFADGILKLPFTDCMKSKYLYFGKDWQDWRGCSWVRDTAKEDELYYNVLGLKDGEKYNLINSTFRSNSTGKVNVHLSGGDRKVFMKEVAGFTLLDWSKVIERANTIHTVSTAINYIIEILPLAAREIHLYVRRPDEKNFANIDFLFTKKYRLHL